MRTKNSINVANLMKTEVSDDDEIVATEKYEYKTVAELIASAFYENQLFVMDSNRNLVEYDLVTKHVCFKYHLSPPNKISKTSDMPLSISGADKIKKTFRILFTGASEIGFIDARESSDERIPFENHFLTQCERIYNHCHSLMNENQIYIGSSHTLHLFDYRQMKQPIVQWAHLLQKPPMMMSTSLYGGSDVITVASHVPGDVQIFHFNESKFNNVPFKPMPIINSYNSLCERGHFLLSDIRYRLPLSNTGMVLEPEFRNLKMKLFTQNVAGDIFETSLKCDGHQGEIKDEYFLHFQAWDRSLKEFKDPNEFLTMSEKIERKDLIVHDIVRVDGIAKIMTLEELSSNQVIKEEEIMHTQEKPAWKINIEKAREFEDLLAREIMNVWDDIDIEDVQPELFANALNTTENTQESSSDRITRWLKATNDESVVIEEISFSENIELIDGNLTQQNLSQQLATQESTATFQRSKKKKPRIAGF